MGGGAEKMNEDANAPAEEVARLSPRSGRLTVAERSSAGIEKVVSRSA